MKRKIKKCFHFVRDFSRHFGRDLSLFFYRGFRARLIGRYALSFARSLVFHLNQFRISLYAGGIEQHHINEERIKRLKKTSLELHSLLPPDSRFSYSILMAVRDPSPCHFKESLKSALNQSAPNLEILIGLMTPPSDDLKEILAYAVQNKGAKVRIFELFFETQKLKVKNTLAEEASGNFLIFIGQDDWIRPDLLFRYEQTLRIFPDPENRILYCNVNALSEKGYFIPESEYHQPKELAFPYFFKPFVEKGLLIAASLWKKAGGLCFDCKGAEWENLLLAADLAGAAFQRVPISLYSSRFSSERGEARDFNAFLQALQKYSIAKGLDWTWGVGYKKGTVRAIPTLPEHSIQAVILFRDQKELTMKCVRSLLRQKNVKIAITAIDNNSCDKSIGEEIAELGGEVIQVFEPFNYSRLNNLAVRSTAESSHCSVLLLLNNDVELAPEAVGEMLRWIDQPKIGMVGCRLHYPDGKLQHGGVDINFHSKGEMRWEHVEKLRGFDELSRAKTLGCFPAVTAACAMIKRQTFLDVGGFDEMWYPIGYSDTNLSVKIAAKGLKCFYTPYAVGIHHESVSRKSAIEDFENSWWLHDLLIENGRLERCALK